MLKPVIMIGCGGSGQKAVRYVRDAVRRRLLHAGWEGEFPRAWQFMAIDTLTTQEDPTIPFLPANDYVSVSLAYQTYSALDAAIGAKFPKGSDGYREMMGWRPNPSQVMVPLAAGAGQLRAVGRAAGVLALQNSVKDRIIRAFSECAAGGPQLGEVSQHLGVTVPPGTLVPAPITIIVGSLAGGTGAGIMLDVVDLVRRSHLDGQFPVLVGFTPDIFGNVQTDMMAANSAAFMSELMSAYWDNENTDAALLPATVDVRTRGPHSVFLVGRKNMDGLDLSDSKNVYRAVGEALAAVTTDTKVQTVFHNFVTVNWAGFSPANSGGYGFNDELMNGVSSSFGSSTLSIGRDRFRDYLEKLLHRSVVEHLTDGFEKAAENHFGEASAKSMAGEAKVAELARKFRDEFIVACGLQERNASNQVSDTFVSSAMMKSEFSKVSENIKKDLAVGVQMSPAQWQQQINGLAQPSRAASLKRADDETLLLQKEWASDIYKKVLIASTDFSARLSFPVVLKLLELARVEVLEIAAEFRQKAVEARTSADQSREKSRTHLSGDAKGNIAINATPVQETINDVARSISWEWTGRVRDQVAVALESVGTGMMNSIDAAVRQAQGKLNLLVRSQDGKPAVVSAWPQNDGTIPATFAPSPVEFYLEGHETWPTKAKELLERSLGENRSSLPSDPVEAARDLIIRGGFGHKRDQVINGLIWADLIGITEPRWSVGESANVKIDDTLELIAERIDSWLQRPSTDLNAFLSEGLGQYLQTRSKTGVPIADHSQRLSTYRQKLQEALNQSRPLMEIDNNMYATVHNEAIQIELNIQGFPFGEGHPAREITREVIQGFKQQPDAVDGIFSDAEAESVLISSFLKYPVNPSVITSFTQPFAAALNRVPNEGKLRSSFWLWRRARVLENFVPLPDSLRRAAIRGFAVSRALGYMTADVATPNRIVSAEGIYEFPKWLLTSTNQSNILPALLESMVLVFADAPTKGKNAFNAYKTMIEFGHGGQAHTQFDAHGHLKDYLLSGSLSLMGVDTDRTKKLQGLGSMEERRSEISTYLQKNIDRFNKVKSAPLSNSHWREAVGSVDPVDTISLELIDDLITGYQDVLDAVIRVTSSDEDVA